MADVDIRIVRVHLGRKQDTEKLEQEFRRLRLQGFDWAIAGGGTGKALTDIAGFVILERPKPQ